MKIFPRPLAVLAFFLLSGVFASAVSTGVPATYKGLVDSSYVSGPKIDPASLKGKVVLWEYWGLQCPPCLAAMPHLQELYRKHGARGRFVVVGSHVQLFSPAVAQYVRDKGITFPIYQWAGVNEAPLTGPIPYSVLIGADGKIVMADSPTKVYAAVEAEMKKFSAGRPIFPDFKTTRYKAVADSLVYGGKNLEGKIAAIAEKKDAEAKALVKAFSRWAKEELAALERLFQSDPLAALEFYDEIKESLPEGAKEFSAKAAELRKDKAYVAIVELRKKTEKLEKKKSGGKKVSDKEVAALKKKLAALSSESGAPFGNAARELETRLDALLKK